MEDFGNDFAGCDNILLVHTGASEESFAPPACALVLIDPNQKASSTLRSSRAVPHPSTNRALRRLTSEFGRDPVHSTRYGRWRRFWVNLDQQSKRGRRKKVKNKPFTGIWGGGRAKHACGGPALKSKVLAAARGSTKANMGLLRLILGGILHSNTPPQKTKCSQRAGGTQKTNMCPLKPIPGGFYTAEHGEEETPRGKGRRPQTINILSKMDPKKQKNNKNRQCISTVTFVFVFFPNPRGGETLAN